MVEFSNTDEVRQWLDRIEPEYDRPEIGAAFAARAALRVAPFLIRTLSKPKDQRESTLNSVVLASFRAAAAAWVIAKYPKRRYGRLYEAVKSAKGNVAPFVQNRLDAGDFAVRAAEKASEACITGSFAEPASFATVFAAAAVYNSGFVDETQDILSSGASPDASWINFGKSAIELADAPLWLGPSPYWAIGEWRDLKTAMLLSNEDWRVWTDWYEARLDGAPANEDLEIARALIAGEIWRQGPRAVNAEIARLIGECKGDSTSTVYEQSLAQGLIIGDILDAEVVSSAARNPNEGGAPKGLSQTEFDCFVSYATEDEAMAREVVGVLEGAKYRTIAQFKDFDVGGNFVELMNRGLSRSARVVALYSPHYHASRHCQAEWAHAYILDPDGTKHRLVPFMIAPTVLDPLARQIIYKSLVGLSQAQRKTAILEAFVRKPPIRSVEENQKRLDEVASPQARLNERGQIDAGPNAIADKPFVDAELEELPLRQRVLAKTIRVSLPDNAPRVLASCLASYAEELLQFGTQPIMGTLSLLAEALRAELQSEDAVDLGKGIDKLFESFFNNHDRLKTHFPSKHDEVIAEFKIDENKASGSALSEPMKKVDEAAQAALAHEEATPEFARIVSNSAAFANDLASLPLPKNGGGGGPGISLKQRYVVGALAFLGSVYSLATLVDSPAVAALMQAVAKAIEQFRAFLL